MNKLIAVFGTVLVVAIALTALAITRPSEQTTGIKLDTVSFGCFGQTATFSIVLTRPVAEPALLNVHVQYDVINAGEIVGTQTVTYLLSSGEIEHAQTTFQIFSGKTCNSDLYSTWRVGIVSA